MPKSPPPPRSAQNSSGSAASVTRTSSPHASTTSTDTTLLAVKPWARVNHLTPPPSVEPDDGGVGVAAGQRDQTGAVERRNSAPHVTPAPTRAGAGRVVDPDPPQRPGAQQQRAVERALRAVAAGLDGDRYVGAAGPANGRHDVGDVGDLEDGGGLLVDVDDPAEPGAGVLRLVGRDEAPDTASAASPTWWRRERA